MIVPEALGGSQPEMEPTLIYRKSLISEGRGNLGSYSHNSKSGRWRSLDQEPSVLDGKSYNNEFRSHVIFPKNFALGRQWNDRHVQKKFTLANILQSAGDKLAGTLEIKI